MARPKNLPYQFPYVRFHGKAYPLIPITLSRAGRSVNTFALLDSGASMSVFRPEIAEALNISLKKKSSARLGTASGGVDIRTASVQWQVEDTRFQSQIGFSEKFIASFNIIGRQGFFHHFSICFNEMMKTVVMMPLKGLR